MIKVKGNTIYLFPIARKSRDGQTVVIFTTPTQGFCIVHPILPIDGATRIWPSYEAGCWAADDVKIVLSNV